MRQLATWILGGALACTTLACSSDGDGSRPDAAGGSSGGVDARVDGMPGNHTDAAAFDVSPNARWSLEIVSAHLDNPPCDDSTWDADGSLPDLEISFTPDGQSFTKTSTKYDSFDPIYGEVIGTWTVSQLTSQDAYIYAADRDGPGVEFAGFCPTQFTVGLFDTEAHVFDCARDCSAQPDERDGYTVTYRLRPAP